ncbi:MAG: small ribosomal subunit Rsm22 family protein [Opitutaceae bacterium]
MTWDELDWNALERLRTRFLAGPGAEPYWRAPSDLASYALTLGERIGWKWDHVLRELRVRGWSPRGRAVLDWGCGSGVAGRRLLRAYGAAAFRSLTLWDHSPLAINFAGEAARQAFPGVEVQPASPSFLAGEEPIGILLLSHVLNELAPAGWTELGRLIARAEAVLWVEPGTRAVSRRLGAERDRWRTRFSLVAPCPAPGPCPMFSAGQDRHWCHFFAPPPAEIFADPCWVRFGQRAGIDLRSLPYCFLALDQVPSAAPAGVSRVIGRVEHFKPYARLLNCGADGLAELTVPRREAPALCKELERRREPLVYRWRRDGDRILAGEALGDA